MRGVCTGWSRVAVVVSRGQCKCTADGGQDVLFVLLELLGLTTKRATFVGKRSRVRMGREAASDGENKR